MQSRPMKKLTLIMTILLACTACTKASDEDPEKTGDIPAPGDVASVPADAEKTASGLASKILKKGTGTERPGPRDTVEVHYTGWTTDGKMFDSSLKRGKPASFAT